MIHLIKGKKVNPCYSEPYVSEFDIIEGEKIGLLEKNSIKLSLTRDNGRFIQETWNRSIFMMLKRLLSSTGASLDS
jgi:hypothetical protein